MSIKEKQLDLFGKLTWDDLAAWAGSRAVSRGRNYQRRGRVLDLAITGNGGLVAWVKGSERYATRVGVGEEGLPESVCTCPYGFNCKHGVAVVLEYLKQVEEKKSVPQALANDERLLRVEEPDEADEPDERGPCAAADVKKEDDGFLKGKTKAQLIELIHDLAEQYPEIGQDLADRRQIVSGKAKSLVTRLRKEIQEISQRPGWRNHWDGEGYTPDYSGVRSRLEALLSAGCADEVLSLGEELMGAGTDQVEQSHDEGETGEEIAACIRVVAKALEHSSMKPADRLMWAVDAVLQDQYDLFEPIAEYLNRQHQEADWSLLADRLLDRLKTFKPFKGDDEFSDNYRRDHLSNWAIRALVQAGRDREVIPLCETEARKTGSYDRLVQRLLAHRLFEEAERWIHEGIPAVGKERPGVAAQLRGRLREIRIVQEDWLAVAAIGIDEFVRQPSVRTYEDCEKTAGKVKVWPKVRACLLAYLESGALPWEQKGWPLPVTAQGLGERDASQRNQFPMLGELIDIAIYEKDPEQVLRWYNQRPKQRYNWYGTGEDRIAAAIQEYDPDQALAIWKRMAENLIALTKPRAYEEAAVHLRKAGRVMARQNREQEWDRYLQGLKQKHARKPRLIETLDGMKRAPILKSRKESSFSGG